MLDDHQRLAFRVDVGPMQRVAGYDFHIFGKMSFECCNLGGFAGCLSAYDCPLFGSCTRFSTAGNFCVWIQSPTWSILCDDLVNGLGLYAVEDVVADSGDKVAIGIDMHIALRRP